MQWNPGLGAGALLTNLSSSPSFKFLFEEGRGGCSCSCPSPWWLHRELSSRESSEIPLSLLPGVIPWLLCFINHGEQTLSMKLRGGCTAGSLSCALLSPV